MNISTQMTAKISQKLRLIPRKGALGLFLIAVAFLAVGYILYPIIRTAILSLGDQGAAGLGGYLDFFGKSVNQTAVLNTLAVGIMSVVTCGIVGSIMAIYVRFFCRHRRIIQILLMSPVMIPGVIIVVAFMQLYGESGMATRIIQTLFNLEGPPFTFGGFWGIVFVITYTQYVYFYLNLYTALQFIDKNVVESVQSLGGGRWAILRDAIWPVIRPAVITSALTTFVSAIGSYSAPALIGGSYRVLTTQIVMAKTNFNMTLASIEVIVLLLMGIIATLGLTALRRHYEKATSTRAVYWSPQFSHGHFWRGLLAALIAIQMTLVLLPVVVIFYLSCMSTSSIMMEPFPTDFTWENYQSVFTNPRTFQPLENSLIMSAWAILAGLILTVPIALMARRGKSRSAGVIGWMLMLPWCMPASVIAIDLINVFAQPNVFSFGRSLLGTFEILPIAYTIMALPLLLSSSQVAASGVRAHTEDASRSLGAGPLRTFVFVALPAMIGGILSGAILVFVRTMGEYTMSALLYGVYNRPISVSIVTNMQEYHIGVAMAYGTLVILLCCILLFVLLKFDHQRFGLEESTSSNVEP